MGEVIKYTGSIPIVHFPIEESSPRSFLIDQMCEYDLNFIHNKATYNTWLNNTVCIIDSSRDKNLLKRIKYMIPKKNLKTMAIILDDITQDEKSLLKEILHNYNRSERKLRRVNEYKNVKWTHYLWTRCCNKQVRKKIKKYQHYKQIVKLRLHNKYALRKTAAQLKVSLNVVTELWKQIRVTNGSCVVTLYDKIITEYC